MRLRDLIRLPFIGNHVYQIICSIKDSHVFIDEHLIDMSDDYDTSEIGWILRSHHADYYSKFLLPDSCGVNLDCFVGRKVYLVNPLDHPIVVGHIE